MLENTTHDEAHVQAGGCDTNPRPAPAPSSLDVAIACIRHNT